MPEDDIGMTPIEGKPTITIPANLFPEVAQKGKNSKCFFMITCYVIQSPERKDFYSTSGNVVLEVHKMRFLPKEGMSDLKKMGYPDTDHVKM